MTKSRKKGGHSGAQPSLTKAQILAIRKRDADGSYPESATHWARVLQVTGEHVRRIRRGESYQWAGGLEEVLQDEAQGQEANSTSDLERDFFLESIRVLTEKVDKGTPKSLGDPALANPYLQYPEERGEVGAISADIKGAKKIQLDTGEELDLDRMMELPGGVDSESDDQSTSELDQRSPDDKESPEEKAQEEGKTDQPNSGDQQNAKQPTDPSQQQPSRPGYGDAGRAEDDPSLD